MKAIFIPVCVAMYGLKQTIGSTGVIVTVLEEYDDYYIVLYEGLTYKVFKSDLQ